MCAAKSRVVVAMSGGVDSSLTAALLVRQGYEVIGATMQLWNQDIPDIDPEHRGCCSLSAVEDARRVSEIIGIPYYVFNFRQMFQDTVINSFIREYSEGKTPNPCIVCNHYVKFQGFLQRALEIGAQYMATGHYASIKKDDKTGRYLLCKGIDPKKDQSYALYHLNQYTLSHFLMPLGDFTKKETRQMARELNLPIADKPDSQEICFIPNDDYKSFLYEHAPQSLKPGNFVDSNGRIIGRHKGLPLYTVGQRKGLGLAVGTPLYVLELNTERNEIVLGYGQDVLSSELIAGDLNFISIDKLSKSINIKAKIRYGAQESAAEVIPKKDDTVHVKFEQPQRAITPGQSVVFYDGDIVVGGGIILKNRIVK